MLFGQEPAWQMSLGHGPLGQVSQAEPVDLLRPTAKPDSSLFTSELPQCSQVCLRGLLVFSKNSITYPHLLH